MLIIAKQKNLSIHQKTALFSFFYNVITCVSKYVRTYLRNKKCGLPEKQVAHERKIEWSHDYMK